MIKLNINIKVKKKNINIKSFIKTYVLYEHINVFILSWVFTQLENIEFVPITMQRTAIIKKSECYQKEQQNAKILRKAAGKHKQIAKLNKMKWR